MITHLLGTVDHREVSPPEVVLPERPPSRGYQRTLQRVVPDRAGGIT